MKNCVHCLLAKSGHKVSVPFSLTLQAERTNQIVHFDFLYMGLSTGDSKYLVLVKDDLSSCIWLCPAASCDAETVAKELSRWIRAFTLMDCWVRDQGSHLKNSVMAEMASEYNIPHTFTVV